MRWVPWLLGIAGVVQYAVIAATQPTDYVSVDMAYLVMWLSIIGALVVCYLSCYDCGYGGGCGCCDDDCGCGDCGDCMPNGHDDGHEGHDHGPGEHGHAH